METPTPPVVSAASQTNSVYWIRGIVFTALFAALFVAFSWIKVPLGFTSVPITMQTLAIMLAGGLLGATYGFWSIMIVVILSGFGLPLISGTSGLSLLLGFTGGYIWMFPIEALFIGLVSDHLFRNKKTLSTNSFFILFIGIIVFGVLLAYVGGVPWLAHKAHMSMSAALKAGCYPFLIGDTIKAVVAVFLIRTLRPLLPRFK
ncbi:biotin transporter BioY [Paenibacillus solisilvae]|uniref:Biotin transporter n=1 Tax=Paenibacillus solisilvae TaxID=2486751 RepID=A0ABW0VWS2_9BACL